MWDYPGFPSITIAYFGTSDFFFSGHIGNCTLFFLEVWALKERKLAMLVLFIAANEWICLTFMRAHYIIDLIMGLVFGMISHRLGELPAFIYDVKICGFPTHKREPYYFKPCVRCGWSNSDASLKVC